MRESTKATRATILQSAKEIFLECGYQEASMRKMLRGRALPPVRYTSIFQGRKKCSVRYSQRAEIADGTE